MKTRRVLQFVVSLLLMASSAEIGLSAAGKESPSQYLVYVGTYTGQKSKGIYAYRLEMKTGDLTPLGLAAETPSPTFLAIHPNHKVLYSANEISKFRGKVSGAVTAFSIDPTSGKLALLNEQPSAGAGPCHISTDKSGKVALVANYGGGRLASFPITPEGALGQTATFIQHKGSSTNPQRQEGPHAHCINVGPNNKFVFAADLGLDKVLIYKLNLDKATLTENDPPFAALAPGAGPRHFAFTPDGRYCYVISEIGCTMTAFAYNPRNGALKEIQTVSTLPGERERNYSTAEIEVHPSGKFVYGSNRGHNSIAVFA